MNTDMIMLFKNVCYGKRTIPRISSDVQNCMLSGLRRRFNYKTVNNNSNQ